MAEPWLDDQIAGVMWDLECVITHQGYCYPITHWQDAKGKTVPKAKAVRCVAGWEGMVWWSIDLVPFLRPN